jgi:outer membrane protein OmpA-like peptidoglycan-associated protein
MLRLFFIMLFCLFLSGCGSQRSTFVLLPDPGGKVGKISVTNSHGIRILEQAGQSVTVNSKIEPPGKTKIMADSKIRSIFGKAMDIQPLEPAKFLFYFEFESIRLKPESKEGLSKVLKVAADRNSADISINGHTDSAGDDAYNYKLSLRRAEHILRLLEKLGIDPDIVVTNSHGEGNPLVPTADNVYEPRNRRVEVIIR